MSKSILISTTRVEREESGELKAEISNTSVNAINAFYAFNEINAFYAINALYAFYAINALYAFYAINALYAFYAINEFYEFYAIYASAISLPRVKLRNDEHITDDKRCSNRRGESRACSAGWQPAVSQIANLRAADNFPAQRVDFNHTC